MTTATTKNVLLGLRDSEYRCVPDRTPGVLGHGDVADPDVRMCLAGDSQGPVGFGDDAGSIAAMADPYPRTESQFPVLEVDLEAVERFLHSAAQARVMNQLAEIEGWFEKEIVLPDRDKVRRRAVRIV